MRMEFLPAPKVPVETGFLGKLTTKEKMEGVSYCPKPGGSVVKNPPACAGDTGSIPGLGRSPEEGNDNPFQYSCLENPMDRIAWPATVHGVTKSHI